jgi:hypothetical protein
VWSRFLKGRELGRELKRSYTKTELSRVTLAMRQAHILTQICAQFHLSVDEKGPFASSLLLTAFRLVGPGEQVCGACPNSFDNKLNQLKACPITVRISSSLGCRWEQWWADYGATAVRGTVPSHCCARMMDLCWMARSPGNDLMVELGLEKTAGRKRLLSAERSSCARGSRANVTKHDSLRNSET